MIELSSEDSLRLNVLLSQELQAVRIDESKMIVFALTEKGEASVTLNPTGRDDQYLRKVREFFSAHVLDSPGGYPIYLERWTRYSQQREAGSLQNLLLLGEPEAVVAVVYAPGLTPKLARRAWWAMPETENARCMLNNVSVRQSEVGQELARYLIEYLPFETEPRAMLNTVRLVLQDGLTDDAQRLDLWKRAERKGTFYISFLQAVPDDLPQSSPAHTDWESVQADLSALVEEGNIFAGLLCKVLSPEGQTFLKTVEAAMAKLMDQATTVALFEVIGDYFSPVRVTDGEYRDIVGMCAYAADCVDNTAATPELAKVLAAVPAQRDKLMACLALSLVGEYLLDSFFSRSDTVGPLMRRKLAPWTAPLLEQIQRLREEN